MRILSLNAWGGAVFDALAAWLPGCEADVVCLQEVTRTPGLGGWTQFADGERSLPQRANLFDDIRRLLPCHQAMFMASDAGPVRGPDGNEHRQDFGIATFIDERLPVIGQQAEFVHGSFTDHQEWVIADRPRIAHAVRLVDRAGDRNVTLAHLHGLRDPRGKDDTSARAGQARALTRLVSSVRGRDDLTVVSGDLNLLPDSETFAVLGEIGLVDLVGETETRTSLYPKPVRHANYLLVSDPAKVESFEVITAPEVSDHCALMLDC